MKKLVPWQVRSQILGVTMAVVLSCALVGGISPVRASEHFDPCAGLVGAELEKCRTFQQTVERIITKITVSQRVVEALERARCMKETGDWELCWGIYRFPNIPVPGPEPGPFAQARLAKLSATERTALYESVRAQLEADHKRELEYLKELMLAQPR